MSGELNRPVATHVVLSGRLKFNCYVDGDSMIDIATGAVRATRIKGKWNRPVATVKPDNPKAVGRGKWDKIKRLPGDAVRVVLDKGLFY